MTSRTQRFITATAVTVANVGGFGIEQAIAGTNTGSQLVLISAPYSLTAQNS